MRSGPLAVRPVINDFAFIIKNLDDARSIFIANPFYLLNSILPINKFAEYRFPKPPFFFDLPTVDLPTGSSRDRRYPKDLHISILSYPNIRKLNPICYTGRMSSGLILSLFIAIIFLIVGIVIERKIGQHAVEDKIPELQKEAKQDALRRSRAGLGGILSEEVAPLLPNFPGKISEARFMGKPIDYLVFSGMDEKNITEVVFVEVKSGSSRLNENERTLRDAIIAKNVRWTEFHVPGEALKREEKIPIPVPDQAQI